MATNDASTGNHAPWFNISSGVAQKILPELTKREAEISILYSSGIDARSIGHFLCISDTTVNNHLANAKVKLDSRNIADLRSSILLRFLVCQVSNQNNLKTDGAKNV